jgi:hypothetical protein
LRVGLVRLIGVHDAGRGTAGERLFEVERAARDDVDGAGDAAFDEVGLRALVDHDLAHELGREERVADAAADLLHLVQHEPVAGRDGVAVDQRLREAGIGAAHADAIVLVEAAFVGARRAGRYAGYARERVGDVLVRHLADVLGSDDFLDRVRSSLRFERLLIRIADARNDDLFEALGRARRACRHVLPEQSERDGGS